MDSLQQVQTPPQIPNNTPVTSISSSSKSSPLKSILLIVAGILLILFTEISLFILMPSIPSYLVRLNNSLRRSDQVILDLPLKEAEPGIHRPKSIVYQFTAYVTEIQKSNPAVIKVDNDKIPTLEAIELTKFYDIDNPTKKRNPIKIEDIQPGDQIEAFSLYEIATKTWHLQVVNILKRKP